MNNISCHIASYIYSLVIISEMYSMTLIQYKDMLAFDPSKSESRIAVMREREKRKRKDVDIACSSFVTLMRSHSWEADR